MNERLKINNCSLEELDSSSYFLSNCSYVPVILVGVHCIMQLMSNSVPCTYYLPRPALGYSWPKKPITYENFWCLVPIIGGIFYFFDF